MCVEETGAFSAYLESRRLDHLGRLNCSKRFEYYSDLGGRDAFGIGFQELFFGGVEFRKCSLSTTLSDETFTFLSRFG